MSRNNSQALTQRGVSGLAGTKKAGGLTRAGQQTDARDKHTSSLVLRGGQHGIWGTGEIQLPGQHYSGPQKLAYRANSLVTTGLLPPFKFPALINIAWAQGGMSLYTVEKLFDKDSFFDEMTANLKSRPEIALAKSAGNKQDWLSDKKFVATQVAARIHNLFFIASSWRMIWTLLYHMNEIMDTSTPIRPQLLENEQLRKYFLALYDCVNEIIQAGRRQVSQLVISSEHFNQYFALTEGNRVAFSPNTERIREAHKSLLATLMLELALEDSTYPVDVLMACLGDVVADAPRAKHRISQGLWDAIGDLSVAVEFRGQLDAALVGGQKEYREWFGNQSAIEGYRRYKDAIEKSAEAAEAAPDEIITLVNPLDKTKSATGLLAMWKAIQEVYVACTGTNIEALWMLEGAFDSQPHWRTFFLPELANNSDDDDDWYERSRAMQKKRKSAPKKNQLAIADRGVDDSDSDDDLPDLLDVSDSSAEEESSSEEEGDDDWEDESDYDDDAQEKLDDLMQEAQKYRFGESKNTPGDVDDNPFIRVLKGLKGRFATLNPRSSQSTAAIPDERSMKVKSPPKPRAASSQGPPKQTTQDPPRSMKPTVEVVEDDEEGGLPQAAKKKKKKKKKKKTGASVATESPAPTPVASPPPPPTSPTPAPAKPASTSTTPVKAAPKPAPPKRKPVPSPLVGAFDPFGSQISLSLGPETAQSARSYIKQAGLTTEPKSKSKSHAETLPPEPPKEKISMFTRLKRDAMGDMDLEDKGKKMSSDSKKGKFSGLKKRVKKSLRQLLSPTEDIGGRGRKGMKWEEFEKAMVGLNFEVDGSAAGSSVRFSPSNKDRPISFHKPHPDSFIPYNMLIEFSKRLKDQYGWEEDMLDVA